jgi:hypothetical protein
MCWLLDINILSAQNHDKKSHEKVWKIRKKRYLCTRNQKNSEVDQVAAEVLKKKF